jgi:hypothetical protein
MSMRHTLFAVALATLAGVAAAMPPEMSEDPALAQAALLQSAADDFRTHNPPQQVRGVHLRVIQQEHGRYLYLLCGEFLPAGDDAQWTAFATVRTDPYEQWLGGQGEALCAQARQYDAERVDLSGQLQERLERGADAAATSADDDA